MISSTLRQSGRKLEETVGYVLPANVLPQTVWRVGRRVRRQRQRLDIIGHVGRTAARTSRVDVRSTGHFPWTVVPFRGFG